MGIGKIKVDWGNVREKVQDLAAKQPSTSATILTLTNPVVGPGATATYLAYKAPDLKKGDVKEKLEGFWEEIHPSSKLKNEETRGRYRRRVGGAAVGAVGGVIQGGAVGAVLGAGVGAYRAKKGSGQTDDYAITFGIGLAIGYAWNTLSAAYSKEGFWGVAQAAWGLIKQAFGLAGSAGALQKPPGETVEAQGQGAGAQLATNPKTAMPVVENNKLEPVEAYKAWSAVAIATGAVIVLGAK